MKQTADVTCVGEALVDFVSMQTGTTLVGASEFLKSAGGAAANVAVGVAKLGARSAFVGWVGRDSFGDFLHRELKNAKVDIAGLRHHPQHKTRLAFVALRRSGERFFEFWERQPADARLTIRDVRLGRISSSRIVHLSSFLLLDEPARSTVLQLAEILRKKEVCISFDPNLRLSLWKSRRLAKELHLELIRRCTILRLNEEEALFLSGMKSLSAAASKLKQVGPEIVVVTLGASGCYFRTESTTANVPGFDVKVVDTTGCGDAFLAGLLYGLAGYPGILRSLSRDELIRICRFANAVGALTAMKNGVFPALPGLAKVRHFMSTRRPTR
ncbi:MAG TPA: carbohydrate kinase [Bacteroidota bacterium]|jgi:fructokinase|nr:carbohydrate kinase [Bacteroidota bacterium]